VASAELGVAKPEPAIFHHALALVGAEPEGSWHVGDTPDVDVAGALAAGLRPVLVARDEVGASPDVPVVRDLGALAGLIRAGAS
jgi:putative hydrolase of the HAD superfamily